MAPGSAEDLEQVTFLDNRSAPCAVGLIQAARTMETVPAGAVLEIWSRDQFAPFEVPIWATNQGHAVEVAEQTGRWPRRYWRFLIRRAGGAAPEKGMPAG